MERDIPWSGIAPTECDAARIKLALACGYSISEHKATDGKTYWGLHTEDRTIGYYFWMKNLEMLLPDYPADLQHLQEAESLIVTDEERKLEYMKALGATLGVGGLTPWDAICATCKQRATALSTLV